MTNRHGDPASYVRSRQMLIDEIRRRSVATATEGLVREFHNLKPRGYNPNDYNLTELNAAEAVDKGFFSHSDWVAHVARYAHTMKQLTSSRAPQWTLFDFGCGKLQLPFYLYRNRVPAIKAYWGMDLRAQPAWLDDAGWKTPMHLVRGDITEDSFESAGAPARCDIATCFEVFEHIPRSMAPAFLLAVRDQMLKGGLFLFSTPNAGVARSTAENHHSSDGENREWDYDDKLRLLERSGFNIVASYGTFCGLTRLPSEVWSNPVAKAIRAFHHNAFAVVALAAAYPEISNNSLQVCEAV